MKEKGNPIFGGNISMTNNNVIVPAWVENWKIEMSECEYARIEMYSESHSENWYLGTANGLYFPLHKIEDLT